VEAGIPRIASFTDFFGFCYNNKLEAADGSVCSGPNRLRTNCIACHLKALREQGRDQEAEMLAASGALQPWTGVYLQLRRRLSGEATGALAETVLDIQERPGLLLERYRKYSAAIASTKVIADSYRRNGLRVPIHRVAFGVDCDRSPKPARAAGTPLTYGFIGQIALHKGPDLLIEAFRTLPRGASRLVIHGPANQDPRYYAQLVERASGFDVEFRGTFPADEIERKLAEIDVLVIPSRWYENSPLVLLYALATHTPVVVTDLEGLTEFTEEGRSAFAFPKGDVGALAQILRRFIDEPALVPRMNAQARYDQDTRSMTEQVVEIYREVLELPCAA
jgi:glycosyltransferase involved in cell wall biosynthesis